jgi:hypothetical protein
VPNAVFYYLGLFGLNMPPKRLKGIVKDVAFASAATAKAAKRKASVLSASPHGLFDSADGKASNLPEVLEFCSNTQPAAMGQNKNDLLLWRLSLL